MKKFICGMLAGLFLCGFAVGCSDEATSSQYDIFSDTEYLETNSEESEPPKSLLDLSSAEEESQPEKSDPSEIVEKLNNFELEGIEFSNVTLTNQGPTADYPVNMVLSGTITNICEETKVFGFEYALYYDDEDVFLKSDYSNYNYELAPNETMSFKELSYSSIAADKPVVYFSILSLLSEDENVDTLTPNSEIPSVSPPNEPTISLAEFNEIKTGMSYEEVCEIIGSEGELLSESGESGSDYHTVMYMWDGEGSIGANANAMFQGGKLISKAQIGLK